ncbi:MAG: thermonuclease family protein [Proteobacteria bacterium]|nr:thermonuclease family protein [Pseudomonadota bacterium]
MSELANNSIDLIITSPPYWQLKDYGTEQQIGFNDSYEDYINNLNLVWQECYRVLNNGCRLCVNIGDQFARSVYYGRYKVLPIREEIIKFCEILGFDYMGAVIWQKKTTTNTTGGASLMGSYPYPKNGILSIDYEFILLLKKLGETEKKDKLIKDQSQMTKAEWMEYFSGHWNFAGAKQDGHIAMFPEELPKRLIKMFSFVGETVLDPFLGSGTTSRVAKNLNRNSVGYEINPTFIPYIEKKLEMQKGDFFYDSKYEILKPENKVIDFGERIKKLPYRYKDPHQFDKKIDIKKLNFGSKIASGEAHKKEDYFSIKEIINPELVRLNNDIIVRLIGVKENKSVSASAVEFLQQKVKGQKVFLKYDTVKYDVKNNLLVYLYLKNKTFLNAHLIKHGLVNIDTGYEYKNKDKFIALGNVNG